MEYDPNLENLLLQYGFNYYNINNIFQARCLRRIQRIEMCDEIEILLKANMDIEGTIFTLPFYNIDRDRVIDIFYVKLPLKKLHKILQFTCFI